MRRPYPEVSPLPLAPNMPRRTPMTSGPLPSAPISALCSSRKRSSPQQTFELDGRRYRERCLLGFPDRLLAVHAEWHLLNLVVQLEDRVQQHLRPGRAAGEVDV